MSLLDSIKERALDAHVREEIERSVNYFEQGGVNTDGLDINKENDAFRVTGTVGDWEQLGKLNSLIEAADTNVVNEVELEDWTAKNVQLKVVTKGSNLNVRSGAGTDNDVVGKFANGANVTLVKKVAADWYEVQDENVKGYCHTNYLEEV